MTRKDGPATSQENSGRLPDAIIIGAAKSATTSLFHRLIQHPAIFNKSQHHQEGSKISFNKDKELCFFSDDPIYAKGMDWYTDHFANARADQLCIEASTNYTRWPQLPATAERMAKHVPNARLIYIVRHPVDRAYSHYVHRYTRELHPGEPFRAAFEEHVEVDPMCIDSSLYMKQLERFLEHYPRSAIHVLLTSDLKRHPRSTLDAVCQFLEIDPQGIEFEDQSARESNDAAAIREGRTRGAITGRFSRLPIVGPIGRRLPKSWKDRIYRFLKSTARGQKTAQALTPPPMTPEVRARYLKFFEGPNAELARFLGRDLAEWSV